MKYFEIKVTGCKNCPKRQNGTGSVGFEHASKCWTPSLSQYHREMLYEQNKDKLTTSCPMWQETKEQV